MKGGLCMPWTMSSERPIYLQLVDRIKRQIAAGTYSPGDRFPSVRELALEAAVNPNTMQRALAALEADGLLITSRTAGRTVTTEEVLIRKMKEQIATEEYERFYQSMRELGYDDEGIREFIREAKVPAVKGGES